MLTTDMPIENGMALLAWTFTPIKSSIEVVPSLEDQNNNIELKT